MEKKPIGEKLSNISALIQKQQPNRDQNNPQDEMKQYKMIFPNMQQQGSQGQIPLTDQEKLQQVQSIIEDQKQFQNDISKLLDRIGKIQGQEPQPNNSTPSQQKSPNTASMPSQNQTPNNRMTQSVSVLPKQSPPQQLPQPIQLFVQNSPINDQSYRNLKEQNVDLLRQIAQLQPLAQTVNELKTALQQSNDRIREQQKQIDLLLKDNGLQKQQIILSEQEKINNKRQFDEIIANQQLAQQRDLQAIRFQAQENLNALENTWKQQYVILKTENDAVISNQNAKLTLLQKDNQNQQDIINNILNQNKELQRNLQQRIDELNIYHQALEEKKLEFDKLQINYNNSLEKYDTNMKQLINQYSQQQKQQEQIINELKQHNTILSQQMVELDQAHKQSLQSQQIQVQHHINGKLEEVQKVSIVEKQQLQQMYEDKLNKLSQDKESILSQKQQSILFLEQKLAILVQENKTLVEQLGKIKKKADTLEQAMLTQEAVYQNLTKDSQYKTLSLTKQIQELNSMIGNSANNQQNYARKSDTFDSMERIQQLEQQLQYKKEEMDLLLHHLDQVFEINRDFENKIKTLSAQLELMEEKNNRESDQSNNLIKNLKQQIEDLKDKLELNQKIEQDKDSQLKELQQKLAEAEILRKKQNDQQLINEKQSLQELIKQLKIKNVELINTNEFLESNLKEIQQKYDQVIQEKFEQQQHFEEQKEIIEQQIQTLQRKNQEQSLPPQSQFRRDAKQQELEKQIQEKENLIKQLEQKIRDLEKKNREYEPKQRVLEDQVNQAKQMANYQENKAKELELRIGTYDDQIKMNNKQLNLNQQKIKSLEQQLLAAEDDVQRLSNINQELENYIAKSKQTRTSNNQNEIQKLEESNLQLQEQINQLKKEKNQFIQSYETQINNQQQQIQSNQDLINQMKKEKLGLVDNYANKISKLEQIQAEKTDQINQLKHENSELEVQNKLLSEQVAKLKKEKAQMTMKLMHSGMANLIGSQVSTFSEKNL